MELSLALGLFLSLAGIAPHFAPRGPLFRSNASRLAACLAISEIDGANIAKHFLFTADGRFKLFFVK